MTGKLEMVERDALLSALAQMHAVAGELSYYDDEELVAFGEALDAEATALRTAAFGAPPSGSDEAYERDAVNVEVWARAEELAGRPGAAAAIREAGTIDVRASV